MAIANWNDFKGSAKRLDDIDLPKLGHEIGVGEDEIHAFMDVESGGTGFDKQGRPKMLFEPHVFYRNLSGEKRAAAVKAKLAYPKWKNNYPSDSYPRLLKAVAIDETAALKSASWGLMQILGENYAVVGYVNAGQMVRAFMDDEETHLAAAIAFLVKKEIDDDLRAHRWLAVARVYNGPGKAADYGAKLAAAFAKWSKIRDTKWSPDVPIPTPRPDTTIDAIAAPDAAPKPLIEKTLIEKVQALLRERGYPEVGTVDGKMGDRTRDAILAFQAGNALALTGEITDGLLAELVKAPQRVIAPERAEATATDLKGAPSVDMAVTMRNAGGAIAGISTVGAIVQGLDLDGITERLGKFKAITDMISGMPWWVIGGAAGAGIIWFARNILREQVQAFREGRHV